MTFYQMCRPIYRVGHIMFWIGLLVASIGLMMGLSGKGWTALMIGGVCFVLGGSIAQIPVVHLANHVKLIDESLTAKQASDLVSRHLRERGEDADDPQVFLGKFGENFDLAKSYRKYAERGNADSQYHLGRCYRDGTGVIQNDVEAVKWYRKAAEQGFAAAQYCLGLCYRDGVGVAKDDVEGEKWCRKAEEQGYVPPPYLISTYHPSLLD